MTKLCKHCSGRLKPCGCHGHEGIPYWKHQATGHHRCGPDGTGEMGEP